MKAPLLIVAPIIAFSVAVAACGDADEEVAPDPSLTPAASSTTPPVTTPSPTAASTTPVPVPSDWKTYSDQISGIRFRYPPDLVATELAGGEPQGEMGERVIDFRSPDKAGRAISLSVFEDNPSNFTLDQFADEAYCTWEMWEGSLLGVRALICEHASIADQTLSVVVGEYGGRFFVVQATPGVSAEEFAGTTRGAEFVGQ
jgi:hypothetical protein